MQCPGAVLVTRPACRCAQVYLGAYGLASSPANLPLDAGFIKAVAPLCTAASQNRYDPYALQGLVDNYG